jgi:predicted nucleic acid-binding protein
VTRSKLRLLIMDANVLIDFLDTDASVLALISQHVGSLHVARPVVEEVAQFDESTAESLGITVVDASTEVLLAAASGRGRLSFPDRLCLVLAREKGWSCVSNDGRLRRACTDDGVEVLWGLEVIAMLVEAGALPVQAARDLALDIQRNNPRFITDEIVDRFLARLGVGRET